MKILMKIMLTRNQPSRHQWLVLILLHWRVIPSFQCDSCTPGLRLLLLYHLFNSGQRRTKPMLLPFINSVEYPRFPIQYLMRPIPLVDSDTALVKSVFPTYT